MKNKNSIVGLFSILTVMLFSASAVAAEFVKGELVVKLKPQANTLTAKKRINALHARIGAKARSEFKLIKNLYVMKLPAGMDEYAAEKYYLASGEVEYAEPNYIYHAIGTADESPDEYPDEYYDQQWGLQVTETAKAWMLSRGSRKVTVAVIDTGVDYNNPELKDNMVPGWNFVKKNADPRDDFFHGTHCAGVIGAKHDGKGIMGVNSEVSIMPLKFLGAGGGGTLEDAILATEWAIEHKADIMSNSWGGDGFSKAMREVIVKADEAGILYVAAAGNEHGHNDVDPTYPAGYDVPNVISVAASDPNDAQALFTNWGLNSVHLFAPGVKVLSTVLKNGYKKYSGTSMAAPHVAGAAALLKAHTGLDHHAIKARLLSTVDKFFAFKDIVASGGRLNVYNAMMGITKEMPADPKDWTEKRVSLESPHPYPSMAQLTYTVEQPGAKFIKLHFSNVVTQKRVDYVGMMDRDGNMIETLSGNQGAVWTRPIPGDKVTIVLRSDSQDEFHGFSIDGYAYK